MTAAAALPPIESALEDLEPILCPQGIRQTRVSYEEAGVGNERRKLWPLR